MRSNPNFVPSFSTDEVYVGQDLMLCLTDELGNKAYISHNHDDKYSQIGHEHIDYALKTDTNALQDAMLNKANTIHSHKEYSLLSHTHDDYIDKNIFDTLKLEVDKKADASHSHMEYAPITELNKINSTISNKADLSHSHDDRYYTEGEVNSRLSSNLALAKSYADDVKNDLLNGAGSAYDTLKELGALIDTNVDAIKALETVASNKANIDHTHNYASSTISGGSAISAEKLDSSAGSITQPIYFKDGKPVATTHTLEASVPSNAKFTDTVYTLPFAGVELGGVKTGGDVIISNGVIAVNDNSHKHTIGNVSGLQGALNNKINKDLQITKDDGSAELSILRTDNKNILTEILKLPMGVHTVYSQSGTLGNPKNVEAWRMLVHKTDATICWVQAYGSLGSVYTNYHDSSNGWRGWKCMWDCNPEPLWKGAYYMSSPNSTPQTVVPSKKLSECQHGWLLLWSDYDAGKGENDADFVTTMIPKCNPTGGKWGGKSFLCDIPRFVGDDNVATEKRIMKPIYVHDNCIKGSYQNDKSERNDVVLRAVYEY